MPQQQPRGGQKQPASSVREVSYNNTAGTTITSSSSGMKVVVPPPPPSMASSTGGGGFPAAAGGGGGSPLSSSCGLPPSLSAINPTNHTASPLPFPVKSERQQQSAPLETLRSKLSEIEEKIGYKFKDRSLLQTAFMHRSYASQYNLGNEHNERIEFLGDSVLGLVTSEYLYKNLPSRSEGELSTLRNRLVDRKACQSYTEKLNIGQYLEVGKGERNNVNGQGSMHADLFEAVAAAIYLDGGLGAAKNFILSRVGLHIHQLLSQPEQNWKSVLQMYCQKNFGKAPTYKLLDASGPDHSKVFTAAVIFDDVTLGTGQGNTRKIAEQQAALDAVRRYGLAKTQSSTADEVL